MDIAFLIFALTYIVIALGQPPLFRIDRTGAAIIGASLMLISKTLSVYDAYESIDYKTIIILFGMMVLIANIRLSGFFYIVQNFILSRVKNPHLLLASLILISGLLSAFFINDTVCLIFTPFILELTRRLNLDSKPYLLALCMSANIGSVATITGNPQNIIIGSASGIGYGTFFLKMFPVALIGLIICFLVISIFFRKELSSNFIQITPFKYRYNRALVIKSSLVALVTLILFFAGVPMEIVAVGVGSFLLITRRIKPEKVYAMIDFRLLILFIGLFIVIKGFENSVAFKELVSHGYDLVQNPPALILSSAVLSNIVSNVPAVLVLKPLISNFGNSEFDWLCLAMSSTLAGNLTIVGSIANIIVLESASSKVKVSFWEYAKVGIPVTFLTMATGYFVLYLLYL